MKTERTATFLMANLGSEVSRLLSSLERKDVAMAQNSRARAETILHEIELKPEMKPRQPEIKILEEVIQDLFETPPHLSVSKQDLNNYFLPFATRALSSVIPA